MTEADVSKGIRMKIDLYSRGKYQIIRIEDDLRVIADLSELKFLIEGYVREGRKNIVVSFTNSSYIYSGALAILIECYKKIKEQNGDLFLLEPNEELLNILTYLNLNQVINIYHAEDDLPGLA